MTGDLFLIIFYTNLLFLYIDICSFFSMEMLLQMDCDLHTIDVLLESLWRDECICLQGESLTGTLASMGTTIKL